VVWVTLVLETAARKGFPSRAEVTDAAVGERAECVMLNQGPFVVQAVRTLDDILQRMESHQLEKTPLFRRLRSLGLD
jgi:pyruvate kinase